MSDTCHAPVLNAYLALNRSCNLRCRYCYLPIRNRADRLNFNQTAEDAADRFLAKCQNEGVRVGQITLHGAEPTMLEPEVLGRIVSKIHAASGQPVGIQTNGTLVSSDYLDSFESEISSRLMVKWGISIDGPAHVHDPLRNNSHAAAMLGLANLNERGYHTSILVGVSAATVRYLDIMADWCRDLVKRRQAFSLKLISGDLAMSPKEKTAFGLWLHRAGLARKLHSFKGGMCINNGNSCFWLELEMDGKVYTCNRGYVPASSFANWHRQSFAEIAAARRSHFAGYVTDSACKTCFVRPFCNSGCPLDRVAGKADDCEIRLAVYHAMVAEGLNIGEFFLSNRNASSEVFVRAAELRKTSDDFDANHK